MFNTDPRFVLDINHIDRSNSEDKHFKIEIPSDSAMQLRTLTSREADCQWKRLI
jgi:hypothetical protein